MNIRQFIGIREYKILKGYSYKKYVQSYILDSCGIRVGWICFL